MVGQVVDEAEVVDEVRLVVEAPCTEGIFDLAVEPGVVHEHASVGQSERGQRRRQVELDSPDLAVENVGDEDHAGRVRWIGKHDLPEGGCCAPMSF